MRGGDVLPAPPGPASAQARQLQVLLLIGSNRTEGRPFAQLLYYANKLNPAKRLQGARKTHVCRAGTGPGAVCAHGGAVALACSCKLVTDRANPVTHRGSACTTRRWTSCCVPACRCTPTKFDDPGAPFSLLRLTFHMHWARITPPSQSFCASATGAQRHRMQTDYGKTAPPEATPIR